MSEIDPHDYEDWLADLREVVQVIDQDEESYPGPVDRRPPPIFTGGLFGLVYLVAMFILPIVEMTPTSVQRSRSPRWRKRVAGTSDYLRPSIEALPDRCDILEHRTR